MPARSSHDAKTRLGATAAAFRRELVCAMLADVLRAAAGATRLAGTLVVTRDPEVATVARRSFAWVLRDAAPAPLPHPTLERNRELNAALAAAASELARRGAVGAVVVAADAPLVAAEDLDRLAGAIADGAGVALASDQAGTGTNALACRPPDVIPFSFGPGSAQAHRAHAERRGLPFCTLDLERLALDLDQPGDLEQLEQRVLGGETRRVLDALRDAPCGGASGHSVTARRPS